MDAAGEILLQVTPRRRFMDLVTRPALSYAGAAMYIYTFAKLLPAVPEEGPKLLEQGPKLLAHGGWAWLAAVPFVLFAVGFALVMLSLFLRIIVASWRDAVATKMRTTEGVVGLASIDGLGHFSGQNYVARYAVRLSVEGHMFTSVPEWVVARIRVGDRVRVVHTARVNYVVELVRLQAAE